MNTEKKSGSYFCGVNQKNIRVLIFCSLPLSLSLSLSIDLAPSKRRKIGDVKHDDVCTNNVSVLRFFLLRELFKFHWKCFIFTGRDRELKCSTIRIQIWCQIHSQIQFIHEICGIFDRAGCVQQSRKYAKRTGPIQSISIWSYHWFDVWCQLWKFWAKCSFHKNSSLNQIISFLMQKLQCLNTTKLMKNKISWMLIIYVNIQIIFCNSVFSFLSKLNWNEKRF